jgi:hypothetical protein
MLILLMRSHFRLGLEAERFPRSSFSLGAISACASVLSLLMQGIGVAFCRRLLSESVLLTTAIIIQMWIFSIIMVILSQI